ncbi:DUF3017 domain-containing protein [Sporichthya sp.]|uniref:DUF3017 domain-containing protein n=1 Tax=Sporichthya sp. TaxID=65475 RepID=UPI0017EEE5CB|nr:DUF3017 domain-containing protein [Sporichthya sp.]MBA3743189.1 DUF3017 domain-containing protein [Sporichthya sp.]
MSTPPRRPPRPVISRVVAAEWPLVTVLAVCTAGVLVVLSEHFRRGTVLFAGGLVLAAGLRALLPSESAGLLVVRGRLVDVITLTALGLGVLLAALVVPPPS